MKVLSQDAVPSFVERSDRWWEAQGRSVVHTRSTQEITNALRDWANTRAQIDRWDKGIAGGSQALAAAQGEADQSLATWKATQAARQTKPLPKPVLLKVAEVLKEATQTDALLRDR